MTTVNVSATRTAPKDAFLRFALRLDAVVSGIVGVGGLALAPRIAEMSGTASAFEYSLAAFFVAYGIAVYGLSRMAHVRTIGIVIALGNAVFTVAAVAAVVAGIWPLTTFGIVLTLACGVFTLVMADLQYLGVRRMS
ncbi:hypothetical protein TUM20983_11620 [Mycobacterium antarcticum]|uniref:hypothetical protein n=1 Tax=Mycolicibacterium sp. TUM20983 TaxID=3023369 RepID=UPI0023A3A41D|nr:hypothetical protein [Mycolicibacterium sp. TUM20983]GLP74052.1 hypothetical protein TUM20983_11620 [Mycolicibacterium sp. TUM20983]